MSADTDAIMQNAMRCGFGVIRTSHPIGHTGLREAWVKAVEFREGNDVLLYASASAALMDKPIYPEKVTCLKDFDFHAGDTLEIQEWGVKMSWA